VAKRACGVAWGKRAVAQCLVLPLVVRGAGSSIGASGSYAIKCPRRRDQCLDFERSNTHKIKASKPKIATTVATSTTMARTPQPVPE
jgi:uncharacterized protein (DUF697 family)